jgi:two-component system nitrogen regulation sensor histidine kinase GlnL
MRRADRAAADKPDHVLVLLENRELAGRLDRAMGSKSAAKSAIGMAEMLAHEIKNPLAGITGAAQLLSMNASGEDRELTDLIVAETRRIVALLGQVEQFGNLRPPERRAVNIHDVLDRARKSAEVGFAAIWLIEEDYDPSLPPTYGDPDQLHAGLPEPAEERRGGGGSAGGTIRIRTFYDHCRSRCAAATAPGAPLPLQVEIIDDGPGPAARDRRRHLRTLRLGPRERHRARACAGVQDHFRPRRLDLGGFRPRPHRVPHLAARGSP